MTVVLVLQADYQERVDPNDKQAQTLLEEMRAHTKKAHTHLLVLTAVDGLLLCVQTPFTTWCVQLEEMRKNEDPRLSFSTPEFKEAQRMFSDGFKVPAPLFMYLTNCTTIASLKLPGHDNNS